LNERNFMYASYSCTARCWEFSLFNPAYSYHKPINVVLCYNENYDFSSCTYSCWEAVFSHVVALCHTGEQQPLQFWKCGDFWRRHSQNPSRPAPRTCGLGCWCCRQEEVSPTSTGEEGPPGTGTADTQISQLLRVRRLPPDREQFGQSEHCWPRWWKVSARRFERNSARQENRAKWFYSESSWAEDTVCWFWRRRKQNSKRCFSDFVRWVERRYSARWQRSIRAAEQWGVSRFYPCQHPRG